VGPLTALAFELVLDLPNAFTAANKSPAIWVWFRRKNPAAIAAHAGCAEGLIHRYFNGKAGLLLAIIHSQVSHEVVDLNDRLPLPMKLEDEILQLVDWEVERMWEDRDFLSVIIPSALLDPEVRQVLGKIGPSRRAKAIAERLKHFKQCRILSDEDREAIALFIGGIGFIFGFMRPVVLGQNRGEAKKKAITLAHIFVRGLRVPPAETSIDPTL
jgi:AcrR family transcriptional regulator